MEPKIRIAGPLALDIGGNTIGNVAAALEIGEGVIAGDYLG
jgi:hypothetical protein